MAKTEGPALKTGPAIMFGILTVLGFTGGLVAWSSFAPLESAAIAPGFVSIETHRKTIEHLEGGIIKSILVREGDEVKPGQTLIVLDPTQASANLAVVEDRRLALIARAARLIAEKEEQSQIIFPEELGFNRGHAEVGEIVEGEIEIFETHKETLESQISVLKQQNVQFSELITGLKEFVRAQDRQLQIMTEEIELYQKLLEKGLTQKPRVLELQARSAEIMGRRSQNQAEIARANQRMTETDLRIADLRSERKNEAAEELRAVQTELLDLESQILVATDVLKRTVVTSPLEGTIVALQIFTTGGVLSRGDPIMDIVPKNDRLLVDARVDPKDIDVVYPGLSAKVHLTAFHKRHVRPLQGQVMSVSADRLIEDRTGEAYYLVRIELTESPADVIDGALLHPGMTAEVMIVTGTRTALEYLLEPITRSFDAAFRES